MMQREVFERACALLEGATHSDPDGYVHLQVTPYRSHHLLAAAVLGHSSSGAVVFEGGVSSGYFARVLTSAGLVVDGFELDETAAVRAREVCRHVWVGDLQEIDPTRLAGPYDVVLFGDTLEHISDPVSVLRRLRSAMHDDGVLIVSIPNFANWAVRLQILSGRFRYTDRGILDRTHLRFYTERSLRDMLRDAGFSVVDFRGSIPVPGVHGERLCRLAHRVGNTRRSLFAYGFVAVAKPS